MTAGLWHSRNDTDRIIFAFIPLSGNSAALLQTYSSANPGFTDGDWLKWNLALSLAPQHKPTLIPLPTAVQRRLTRTGLGSGNSLFSGEIALLPLAAAPMTLGGSHNYDGVFDLD